MQLLIADSGSTKTDWAFINHAGKTIFIQTPGLNPYFTSDEEFANIFTSQVLPHINDPRATEFIFYGAGCGNNVNCNWVETQLLPYHPLKIYVGSDLLGAARAVLQHEKGIACILGTGSNAGLYNGNNIIGTALSLGYILGDEGSGACIGKHLVTAYLRQEMPVALHEAFAEMFNMERDEILKNVYTGSHPNRYLANFARFADVYRDDPWIKALLAETFSFFFWRTLSPIEPSGGIPLGFTGAIAMNFSEILKEVAETFGFTALLIEPSPIKGLVRYHTAD